MAPTTPKCGVFDLVYSPMKHPSNPLAFASKTCLMLLRLHGLNWRLFLLSPEVALANMM